MLNGRGNAPNIVCPLHRWTYDLKGELLGAPHFADKPCLEPRRARRCRTGTGLLFDGKRDVARDLAGARRAATSTSRATCSTASRCTRQLQLEDVHRGLSRGLPRRRRSTRASASSSPATTSAGNSATAYSVQTVGLNNSLAEARHAHLRALAQGRARLLPRRGAAAWRDLAHVLSERDARVVSARARRQHAGIRRPSTARSTSSSSTIPRRSRCSSASSSRPSRRRTWKRRAEDDEIAERMDAGRHALYAAGRSEIGPVPVADGRRHAALPRVLPRRDGSAPRLGVRPFGGHA